MAQRATSAWWILIERSGRMTCHCAGRNRNLVSGMLVLKFFGRCFISRARQTESAELKYQGDLL